MRGSDYAQLRAFAEVATQSSFARAAERLRVAPSSLSATIRALEERLGVRLINRTTRRLSLTGAGARLLDRFGPAMAEMEAAVEDAREQNLKPRGLVRLHVPRAAYRAHVKPTLRQLARILPDVALDVTVDDTFGDLVADGFDLFVLHSEDVDTSMNAVALGGDLRHVVVASPAYLRASGTPTEPAQLVDHRCINWRRPRTTQRYRWRFRIDGEIATIAVSGPLTTSLCEVAIDAARAGLGIAYTLEPLALASLRAGYLVSLLESYLPPLAGWRLCYSRQRQAPAAVLAVAELLTTKRDRR